MIDIVAAFTPVFLLILAGFVLQRTVITEQAHWVGIEQLAYYVLFPALIIETLARADFGTMPVFDIGGALFGSILLTAAICFALKPLLFKKLGMSGPAFTSFFQGATRWNSFIALAVTGNLYGNSGVALSTIAIVVMIPPLNIMAVGVLTRYASHKPPNWQDILLALARNPLIWSCIIGMALKLLHPPIPAAIFTFADTLGRSSLALGLLVIGAGLKVDGLVRPHPVTLITIALKLIVMPALAVLIARSLGVGGTNLTVVACCSGVPSAATAYVLARQMGGDAPLMAQIITLQTLVAVITLPVVIAIVSI
ncbi:MAG TPA: AEC family transporter [Xanthobacteraceae bacterium]|jgi:hypothetical protein|nr:AEC family transporter [Xanthobacteraceae bacterium]